MTQLQRPAPRGPDEKLTIAEVCAEPAPDPATDRPAPPGRPSRARTAYLATVIDRGAARLVGLTDGRKRALAALAYQIGGLLAWSGLPQHEVTARLTAAGNSSACTPPMPSGSSLGPSPTAKPSRSPHHPPGRPASRCHAIVTPSPPPDPWWHPCVTRPSNHPADPGHVRTAQPYKEAQPS
jgi:hypothetical protein